MPSPLGRLSSEAGVLKALSDTLLWLYTYPYYAFNSFMWNS